MIPGEVDIWLRDNNYGGVTSTESVGGGCINNGQRLVTTSGQSFFLKTNPKSPKGMFDREAEGLESAIR